MIDETIKKMLEKAKEAMSHAYNPYSGLAVGAALLADDGNIYVGCNVENLIFHALHAETAAIAAMISHGGKKIKKIVIVSDNDKIIVPCGSCRQNMYEFSGGDLEVHMFNFKGDHQVKQLSELLPYVFGPEFLEEK